MCSFHPLSSQAVLKNEKHFPEDREVKMSSQTEHNEVIATDYDRYCNRDIYSENGRQMPNSLWGIQKGFEGE